MAWNGATSENGGITPVQTVGERERRGVNEGREEWSISDDSIDSQD